MNAIWEYFVHGLCCFQVNTWSVSVYRVTAETDLAAHDLILTAENNSLEPSASLVFHPILQSIFSLKEVSEEAENHY